MKQANSPDQPSLAVATTQPQAVAIAPPTSLDILEKAVRGGVTSENVAVVKEIIAMRREEVSAASKASFNRAFFDLRRELGGMDFYADKAAMNNGKVAYRYCSETELSAGLEPVLFRQRTRLLIASVLFFPQTIHTSKPYYQLRNLLPLPVLKGALSPEATLLPFKRLSNTTKR